MKKSGFLTERINVRMPADLRVKLDAFAHEFDITTAEAARFALYELINAYEDKKEQFHYYHIIQQRIDEMCVQQDRFESAIQPESLRPLNRLEQAFHDGLVKKNYRKLPQTKENEAEKAIIYLALMKLDEGSIDENAFRRRVRYYLFEFLKTWHKDIKHITLEELEQKVEEKLKQLLG